jgi:glycosyltransferase involved in cell wall biosynthesis
LELFGLQRTHREKPESFMNPLVSIILPLYNAGRFISETIVSVLSQSYSHWELIIIDDGSKDSSASIVKSFLPDERIHYYYQPNSGVSTARNNGINKAKGELIAFLDADDTWKKTNLEEKVTILENGRVDFVFSDMELMNENSESKNITVEGTDQSILEHYLLWDRTVIPGPCSNLIVKRKCFEEGLKFDSAFSTAADQDFCFNLASRYKGKRIAKALWNYRILPNSMSKNIAVMEKDHIGVFRKAMLNNLFPSFAFRKKSFSNLYLILAGSWWKDGKNKKRGALFILRSALSYPPNVIKLFKKVLGVKK